MDRITPNGRHGFLTGLAAAALLALGSVAAAPKLTVGVLRVARALKGWMIGYDGLVAAPKNARQDQVQLIENVSNADWSEPSCVG